MFRSIRLTGFVLALLGTAFQLPAATSAGTACAHPESRQFDFWVGNWEVYDRAAPQQVVAHVDVERILGGCVLHERYSDVNGLKGESFSIYDATRKVWHQSWVTNRGQLLTVEGHRHGKTVTLRGVEIRNGAKFVTQVSWAPLGDGSVREWSARSPDGGKTWQPWFDLIFRPATASAGSGAGAGVL